MPDQLTPATAARPATSGDSVLVVGAGNMAIEYSKVLTGLGRAHQVLGRGAANAARFAEVTGIVPSTGTLDAQLARLTASAPLPPTAIVTVNAMHLAEVTNLLARAGVRRLLVEKPAALDRAEMDTLVATAADTGADIRIGYNRRYLASVAEARRIIAADGGPLSVRFDFSEPSRRIGTLGKPQRELDTWFFGNSLHVVDLAVHLAGGCAELHGTVAGGVPWHPAGGVFAGHGLAPGGAVLSWSANWIGPGRWGLEVVTAEHKLILQPLERLRVQTHAGFDEVAAELDLGDDTAYKPGLARQVRAFLDGEDNHHLATVAEQAARWPAYEAIRSGAAWRAAAEDR